MVAILGLWDFLLEFYYGQIKEERGLQIGLELIFIDFYSFGFLLSNGQITMAWQTWLMSSPWLNEDGPGPGKTSVKI